MLAELRIQNFAIIDNLEIDFSAGLVTFTGETGAGKSIILDAIEALVGARTDSTSIRAEEDRAQLEAVFRITDKNKAALLEILAREDLLEDDQYVTLSRELRREGRTVARVNGHTVNLALLRELGSLLVDIHGQSEHLSLLHVRNHLGLIDRFAGLDDILNSYKTIYRQLRKVQRELEALYQQARDADRRKELLGFQVEEIKTARPIPGEEIELKDERNRLANAESLAEMSRLALSLLDEGESEMPTISDLSGQLVNALAGLAKIDAARQPLLDQAENIAVLLQDLGSSLRDYADQIEYNPRRLEVIEQRLELLRTLERKYGGSLESVLTYAHQASQELEQIEHSSERIEELTLAESELRSGLLEVALQLSSRRKKAAKDLAASVEAELSDLSMPGAQFEVGFATIPDPYGLKMADGSCLRFDETGVDQAEFLIAPNPGEGLKPMVKIASGGETARLMLALKKVLAQADEIPTLIFDEIDQGIGGRVGFVVGEKLWQLARDHQVLCVTHLPQLAAFGDQHFRVEKQVQNGRTQTIVNALENDARRQELAQMLGATSETHLTTAEETLRTAQERTRSHRPDKQPPL